MSYEQRYPVVSTDPEVQQFYVTCRESGTAHNLAEMFALCQAPSVMTDAVFLEGRHSGSQFEKSPAVGDFYKRVAEQAGQDITGKTYVSGLARYPGDPEAWVSSRGDVRRVCEQRGWGCTGAVEVPVSKIAETGGPYRVADDLVEARADVLAREEPEASRADLLIKAREQLSPDWA